MPTRAKEQCDYLIVGVVNDERAERIKNKKPFIPFKEGLEEWQVELEQNIKKYDKRVLFGAGNMCRNYMKCYGEKYPPLFTCDNNSKLWGTSFEGLAVKSPEELKNLPKDCCVVICNIYYREIESQLRGMGIENIGYFNDEYMPSFYFDRVERENV